VEVVRLCLNKTTMEGGTPDGGERSDWKRPHLNKKRGGDFHPLHLGRGRRGGERDRRRYASPDRRSAPTGNMCQEGSGRGILKEGERERKKKRTAHKLLFFARKKLEKPLPAKTPAGKAGKNSAARDLIGITEIHRGNLLRKKFQASAKEGIGRERREGKEGEKSSTGTGGCPVGVIAFGRGSVRTRRGEGEVPLSKKTASRQEGRPL